MNYFVLIMGILSLALVFILAKTQGKVQYILIAALEILIIAFMVSVYLLEIRNFNQQIRNHKRLQCNHDIVENVYLNLDEKDAESVKKAKVKLKYYIDKTKNGNSTDYNLINYQEIKDTIISQ